MELAGMVEIASPESLPEPRLGDRVDGLFGREAAYPARVLRRGREEQRRRARERVRELRLQREEDRARTRVKCRQLAWRLLHAVREAQAVSRRLEVAQGAALGGLRSDERYRDLGHVRFADFCREALQLHPRTARRRVAVQDILAPGSRGAARVSRWARGRQQTPGPPSGPDLRERPGLAGPRHAAQRAPTRGTGRGDRLDPRHGPRRSRRAHPRADCVRRASGRRVCLRTCPRNRPAGARLGCSARRVPGCDADGVGIVAPLARRVHGGVRSGPGRPARSGNGRPRNRGGGHGIPGLGPGRAPPLGGSRGRSRLPGATFRCAGGASARWVGRSATLVAVLSPMGLQAGQEHVEGPGAQASTHPPADPGDRCVRGVRRPRTEPGRWTLPGAGPGAPRSVPGSRRGGSAALRAPGPRAGAPRYDGCSGPRRSPASGGTWRASPRTFGARHLGPVPCGLRLPVLPPPLRSLRPRRGRTRPRVAPGGSGGPGHRGHDRPGPLGHVPPVPAGASLSWAVEPRRIPGDRPSTPGWSPTPKSKAGSEGGSPGPAGRPKTSSAVWRSGGSICPRGRPWTRPRTPSGWRGWKRSSIWRSWPPVGSPTRPRSCFATGKRCPPPAATTAW